MVGILVFGFCLQLFPVLWRWRECLNFLQLVGVQLMGSARGIHIGSTSQANGKLRLSLTCPLEKIPDVISIL